MFGVMRKVTLQQEMAAAVVLKQAKWERSGGWKNPSEDGREPQSKLKKQVLDDIRKHRSPLFKRNDSEKKIRDTSCNQSSIHGVISNPKNLPSVMDSYQAGTAIGDNSGTRAPTARQVVLSDIRKKSREMQESKQVREIAVSFPACKFHSLLMDELRQVVVRKKTGECSSTMHDGDTIKSVNSSEYRDAETVLFDEGFAEMSEIRTDPVLEQLACLEDMVQHLTRQVAMVSAQMQALVVQMSQHVKQEGNGEAIGGLIPAAATKVALCQLEEEKDDWVDVL